MSTDSLLPSLAAPELTGRLEARIQTRIDAIVEPLPHASRSKDAAKFLASVRNATASTIRQAPAAAQRALACTQDLNISLTQLVRIIEEDPMLMQALLKFANSAYYATGGPPIVSLTRAVQRIGSTGVHNVVLSNMINGTLCRTGGSYQSMVSQVYTHMVRTAALARFLARSFQMSPDEAFSLGLLHDVGKLIIFDLIAALRHQLRRDLDLPKPVVLSALNAVHESFGGLAAIRWSLGVDTAYAIANHHRSPVPSTPNRMSELLFVAERVDHARHGLRPMAVDMWWVEGTISGTHTAVETVLEGLPTAAGEE